ncbi:MAG: anion transporter [Ignavibacteriae bacterium]|nr:anion transporter [Ignavibacteriota bacterium]
MVMGAAVVLLTSQISISSALQAINLDVMVFLFGMFVVGEALVESGFLAHWSYKYFRRAKTRDALLLLVLFGSGIASAFLMNDTLAIIGTPVVLLLARKHQMSSKLLLCALAFGVTIGSVMSPIGNPQNLLIAMNGAIPNPFGTFFRWLFVPTVVNLYVAFLLLRKFYRDDFHDAEMSHSQEPIRDHELAFLSRISLSILLLLIVVKTSASVVGMSVNLHLSHIAVAASLPILVGSRKRFHILRRVDWRTLAFFAAMFVLMESVWQSGAFQSMISATNVRVTSLESILTVSIVVSQLISNVPLVALYQPILLNAGVTQTGMMALAAGSTIAGNALILGAASNVIIIQAAERRAHETITFWEFARVGVPLTIANAGVYWLFLHFI